MTSTTPQGDVHDAELLRRQIHVATAVRCWQLLSECVGIDPLHGQQLLRPGRDGALRVRRLCQRPVRRDLVLQEFQVSKASYCSLLMRNCLVQFRVLCSNSIRIILTCCHCNSKSRQGPASDQLLSSKLGMKSESDQHQHQLLLSL